MILPVLGEIEKISSCLFRCARITSEGDHAAVVTRVHQPFGRVFVVIAKNVWKEKKLGEK